MLFGFVVTSVLIGLLVQYGMAYLPRLLQATDLVSFGRFGWLIEGAAGQRGRMVGQRTDWLLATPPPDPLGTVTQNPDDVRDAACRLVESRTVCSPPAVPDSLHRPPLPASAGGDGFFGIVLWGLLILVVVALAMVAYRYLQDRTPRPGAGDDDVDPDDVDHDDDLAAGTVVTDRSREPRGWREEADAHRSAGRYRDALRCRYRALVGDLARRGLLDGIPGRTTGEERRELRTSAPGAVPSFGEAADLFDAAWYGLLDVRPTDDDRSQQPDREVLARAGTVTHRAAGRDRAVR